MKNILKLISSFFDWHSNKYNQNIKINSQQNAKCDLHNKNLAKQVLRELFDNGANLKGVI